MTRLLHASALLALAWAKIDVQVRRNLELRGTANVIVEFHADTDSALLTVDSDSDMAAASVRDALLAHALDSQKSVEALLNLESLDFEQAEMFWINNVRYIQGASPALVDKLAALSAVSEVRSEVVATIDPPADIVDVATNTSTLATEWGISIIKAPTVWAKGNRGKGVVVGGIDTGVRHTHEALAKTWRKNKGWFDPQGKTASPKDYHGHGSHTMGSSVGSKGIGVAPDASWIACVGCPGSCPESALTACAQFMLCPTDANGKNPNCALHAHVINNSWGSTNGASTWFEKSISAWRKAGIVPVFSNGNSGPNCATVGSPGSSTQVLGVGATGSDDALAYFSSRGPTPDGRLKPDVSAPGYKIRSAKPTGDSDYQEMSGTSMAAPHVTGAVALYLAAHPKASYAQVYAALTKKVDTAGLKVENKNCGGKPDAKYPNNNYGFGRINVAKAV